MSAAASNVSVAGLEPRVMAGSHRVQQQAARPPNGSLPSVSNTSGVQSSYIPPNGIGAVPNTLYQEQWVTPDNAWGSPYTIQPSNGIPDVSSNGFAVHSASTSFAHSPPEHHGFNGLAPQQPVYQESPFTAGPSTIALDFAQPSHTTATHVGTENQHHHQPWDNPTPSTRPQMDDPMAPSYEPQYFDSDILAMLSTAPTSIE